MLRGMAQLTPLPQEAARRLMLDYGLMLARIEPMLEGSVNSNFHLIMEDGQHYFGRIYEEQERRGALGELNLLRELQELGLPVAAALPSNQGELVRQLSGKPFALYPWIEGDILCQARVTPAVTRAVGEQLAQLHVSSSRLTPLDTGRFGPEQLLERLSLVEAQGTESLRRAAGTVRNKLSLYRPRRDPNLPSGIIHGDLFRDNVLWQGAKIAALLDFESASHGSFAYDLMVTMLAWCYTDRFEVELVSELVSAYNAVRSLSESERATLEVEGALACLRFATTRMTDYSLRALPGQAPLRDYRRFLARLEALEAGALVEPLKRLRK